MTTGRDNSFGAFRLLFASLVIVSHSIEMLDGNDAREPLHRMFGGLSLGALAVDGFFLISGYLIAASFMSDRVGYFWKRVLRIYPAFLVCTLASVAIVGPLAGAQLGLLTAGDWVRVVYRTLLLKPPEIPGVFVGLPYAGLNGSMWSISYEFRCYIGVAICGVLGLYRTPRLFLLLTLGVFAAMLAFNLPPLAGLQASDRFVGVLGEPRVALRLAAAFMAGTCFKLFAKRYDGRVAALCAVIAVALQFVPLIAEPALIVLGGYGLFWAVFEWDWKLLRTLNAKDDISYGVYLYAWPIGALLIWYWRDIPLPALMMLTLAGSVVSGAISWFLLEKPALRLKSLRLRPERAAAPLNTP
ncbi:acyltransferase [Phenylobacterium sp.]|uniref:acyltransferase family protein n=1 Tax=Phenylobacterium sp. TaxID=1871053 RepID=UPI00286A949D|nr:acyltransferase [Phenylobacterium sp.]